MSSILPNIESRNFIATYNSFRFLFTSVFAVVCFLVHCSAVHTKYECHTRTIGPAFLVSVALCSLAVV